MHPHTAGLLLVTLLASSLVTSTLAAASVGASESRRFVSKVNNPKKEQLLQSRLPAEKQTPAKTDEGFDWGKLLSFALNLIVGGPMHEPSATDKMDTFTQLTQGEFSWTKLISLGMQLILTFFGVDGDGAANKMDSDSPLQSIIGSLLPLVTGITDPKSISVLARQTTEIVNMALTLLEAVRTSFSQRSLDARSLGYSDPLADAAAAATSMVKTFVQTYGTDDEVCMQKYVCESNFDCVKDTGDSGYLFCQIGTYVTSYALEGTTYTPFEMYNDAGRRGRLADSKEVCAKLFSECNNL